MRENDKTAMIDETSFRRVAILARPISLLSTFLLTALLICSFGCGSSQLDRGQSEADSSSNVLPEITQDLINERINDAWIREVPEETGIAQPISWNFDRDEPKEITVVDKQVNGTRATIVLDIKTGSSPRARAKRQLAGQIRTEWELRTGWLLRRWEIVETENISMKYKDLPKTSDENSNRQSNDASRPPQPPN